MRSLFNYAYALSFVIFFIKAYVVGIHLNCLDLTCQGNSNEYPHSFIKK